MDVLKKRKFKITGIHEFIITKDGKVIRKFKVKNSIVMVGRTLVGEVLAGITGSTEGIDYCALGTGSGAITDSDTKLATEGARKIRGSSQSNDDVFIVAFYFNPSEANGSWTRYGTFIDGADTVDSGILFTHVVVDLTKEDGEGLTINSQYSISDAS